LLKRDSEGRPESDVAPAPLKAPREGAGNVYPNSEEVIREDRG